MNRQTFEHLVQTNKQNRAKRSEKINHLQDKDFVNWLRENNLLRYLK
jgi:hypothetical protein